LLCPVGDRRELEKRFLEKEEEFRELASDWRHYRRLADAPLQSAETRAISKEHAEICREQMTRLTEEMTGVLRGIAALTDSS